jgi:predicted outer membrane repeat protein
VAEVSQTKSTAFNGNEAKLKGGSIGGIVFF